MAGPAEANGPLLPGSEVGRPVAPAGVAGTLRKAPMKGEAIACGRPLAGGSERPSGLKGAVRKAPVAPVVGTGGGELNRARSAGRLCGAPHGHDGIRTPAEWSWTEH